MVEVSPGLGLALSILNLIVWGSWPYLRMQCSLQGPSFTILYFIGQFCTALIFGFILSPSASSYITQWSIPPTDWWRVLLIVIGGGCVGNADFLCSIAMSRIHFSVAFPIYAGLALGVGSALVYTVDGQGDVGKLFGGVAMAIIAIFFLAAAEAQPPKADSPSKLKNLDEAGCVESPMHSQSTEFKTNTELKSATTEAPNSHSTKPWVAMCVFCGVVGGLWCPLSSLGRSARGVTDPLVALVIFEGGQLSSVPLQCIYYSVVLDLFESRPEHRAPSRDPAIYLLEISKVSLWQQFIALATGSLVGLGYTLYFVVSAKINPTVALAIPSCEPLMTIFMGVFVSRNLRFAILKTKLLYLAATISFVVAITLLSLAVV